MPQAGRIVDRREILRCRRHAIRGPWGTVVAPNISQTKDTRLMIPIHSALARGVAADGRRLSPPMGARALIYSRITESDMRDRSRFPAQ